jgi:hypothetical protein
MSKCVFCHLTTGHEETCPREIPTKWGPGSGPWPDLARNILEAWRRDSAVYDRGGSADIKTLEELWDHMERALGTGEAEVAMGHLFAYYEGASTEAPHHTGAHTGETPVIAAPLTEGPHTEGPV